MDIPHPRLTQILSTLGITVGPGVLNYSSEAFTKYVSTEYLKSERHESDEIYRMYELTLLHNATGLRIVYTTSESYFGDSVAYKVIGLYITTQSNHTLSVFEVDFEKEQFITPSGNVAFTDVTKEVERR
jgi:hypothetical protein